MRIDIDLFRFLTELLIIANIFLFLIDIPIIIYGTNKFEINFEGNLWVKERLKEEKYFEWLWWKLTIIVSPLILLLLITKETKKPIILGIIMGTLLLYQIIAPVIIEWILNLV